MRDVFGRPVGSAPDNPEQAAAVRATLGLRLAQPREICHGFANGCLCSNCLMLESKPEPLTKIRQPWEALPLDRAA